MLVCVIWMVLVGFGAGYIESSQPWACSKAPETCLSKYTVLKQADECKTDNDCQASAQCCYRGCIKKCISPNPCEQVICKDGYLCQSRETPCSTPPCPVEATCLPEIQVRCIAPVCNTEECQPGFERAFDSNKCPTCDCVRKKECGPNCFTFCAHGFEEGANGCPLCSCKPDPENPCSNMSCGQNEECRFVKVDCKRAPCKPAATCVSVIPVVYDNACSLTDHTTVGLPVLDRNSSSELNCYLHRCPDNTVCANMGREIKRCCWQFSQDQVFSPPKSGECPPTLVRSELTQPCQVDGECPTDQKCCYRYTDGESSRSYGLCTNPIHNIVKVIPAGCQRFTLFRVIFNMFGIC
uniref:WAP domain-containing protein n=1 Tax=Arion vulgaris TaxID=1028688 RepID=A0A0B7BG48_9EUPU